MSHISLALILMLCGTLAVTTGSDAMPGKGGPPGPNPFMRCINKLNLSTDTLAKIEALFQTEREAMKADRDTMKAAMDTYFTALTASPQDSAVLAQAQQAIIALNKSHEESRFALESSIVALLSADEATQLGQCLISTETTPPTGDNETQGRILGKFMSTINGRAAGK